jgi:alpha-1,3-rhamnosyltransferase
MKVNVNMENEVRTNPLVSIVVVTYNSSKYVLETLESVKAQAYQNIELIVSDDCSVDNTLETCRMWIENNKERFVKAEIVVVQKNTGIASNCNRGLEASEGEWVKFIAGDDTLFDNCIEVFIKQISMQPEIEVLFSNIAINGNCKEPSDNFISFFKLESRSQFLKILEGNILAACSLFIKRETLLLNGGFNEKYPMLEDFPLFISLLKNKYRFYFTTEYLVNYRLHSNGISNRTQINTVYNSSVYYYFKEVLMSINNMYMFFFHYKLENLLQFLVMKRVLKFRNQYDLAMKLISPLFMKRRLDKYL